MKRAVIDKNISRARYSRRNATARAYQHTTEPSASNQPPRSSSNSIQLSEQKQRNSLNGQEKENITASEADSDTNRNLEIVSDKCKKETAPSGIVDTEDVQNSVRSDKAEGFHLEQTTHGVTGEGMLHGETVEQILAKGFVIF